MNWKNEIKKERKETIEDFVNEVIKNAERILDKYTTDYDIDDVPDLELELKDVLRKIFIDLASDYIEENSPL
tara:strand:- start:1189 stop:1404 length:216 start_codon:yes stop_codon:yes gene_type:complete